MLHTIHGTADPAFRSVVQLFQKQLSHARGGAALCIFLNGETLVDVWAGQRTTLGDPWTQNTPCVSFSVTKGVLAIMLHMIMDEAKLDYETQVASIWPSFKQNNKSHLTIRQLLCHESGLFNLEQNIDQIDDIFDWDNMVWRMAKAKPSMSHLGEPSYHAITYGWLIGELIYRLTGQKPGDYLESELRTLMGRHNYIGVPSRHLTEVAHVIQHLDASQVNSRLKHSIRSKFNRAFAELFLKPDNTTRALMPPSAQMLNFNDFKFLQAQIPAMNGVFTARGLAKLYAAFASPEEEKNRIISSPRLVQIQEIQSKGRDKIIHLPMHWRLGFHRILNTQLKAPFGFGHYGYGGSGAWCDPSRRLAVGYIQNSLWDSPLGDFRLMHLSGEILKTVDQIINKSKNEQKFI